MDSYTEIILRCQSGTSKWKSCDGVASIIVKEFPTLMDKKDSEKEKATLDSLSPKFNRNALRKEM